jgi:hypothetical protein
MVTGRDAADALRSDPRAANLRPRKDSAMHNDLLQLAHSRRTAQTKSHDHLIVCSLCLRVLDGSEWKEADQVIREIRSFELPVLPRLDAAVCDACAEAILVRRAHETERAAA